MGWPDGRIARLSGAVLNADGAVLAPGFTDLHVRSGEPGAEYRETLEETVAAALRGGFTGLSDI